MSKKASPTARTKAKSRSRSLPGNRRRCRRRRGARRGAAGRSIVRPGLEARVVGRVERRAGLLEALMERRVSNSSGTIGFRSRRRRTRRHGLDVPGVHVRRAARAVSAGARAARSRSPKSADPLRRPGSVRRARAELPQTVESYTDLLEYAAAHERHRAAPALGVVPRLAHEAPGGQALALGPAVLGLEPFEGRAEAIAQRLEPGLCALAQVHQRMWRHPLRRFGHPARAKKLPGRHGAPTAPPGPRRSRRSGAAPRRGPWRAP